MGWAVMQQPEMLITLGQTTESQFLQPPQGSSLLMQFLQQPTCFFILPGGFHLWGVEQRVKNLMHRFRMRVQEFAKESKFLVLDDGELRAEGRGLLGYPQSP